MTAPWTRDMCALELFGCAGGMAEGFRRAGIEFAASFDCDPNACESYEHNLGQGPIQLDVRNLQRITRLIGATPNALDLVVADPPCTPWSRAGKRRGLEDKRDMLGVTVDLIEAWRPRCWLIGNVPGLDDASNASALKRTLGRLAKRWCIDYASLDAAAYGVPQHRVRPFWFGHPRGTECIRWPQPTHGEARRQLQLAGAELLPYVTVREALALLKTRELGRTVRLKLRRTRHGHPPSTLDRPAGSIASSMPGNGGGVLFYGKDHKTSSWDTPAATMTRNPMCDGALLPNERHPMNTWDQPSYTITEGHRGVQGAEALRSGKNAVVLSELAAAILQGFPAGWQFAGKTKRARWSQIGQAMPPPLAAAVAERIAAWFEVDDVECTSPGTVSAYRV